MDFASIVGSDFKLAGESLDTGVSFLGVGNEK